VTGTDGLKALPNGRGQQALLEWAKNERRARKAEDEDEKIVSWLRETKQGRQEDEMMFMQLRSDGRDVMRSTAKYQHALVNVQQAATKKGSKYSDVMCSGDTVRFLSALLEMPLHFRATEMFKLKWLGRMSDVYGGVSDN
jgi:hypothetical protein